MRVESEPSGLADHRRAGFMGSNLLGKLLLLDQTVIGLDNFSTGHRRNLDEVRTLVSAEQWGGFDLSKATFDIWRTAGGQSPELTTCCIRRHLGPDRFTVLSDRATCEIRMPIFAGLGFQLAALVSRKVDRI